MSQKLDPSSAPRGRSVELLWLDPGRLARVRKNPSWRKVIDDALRSPTDKPGTPSLPHQALLEQRRYQRRFFQGQPHLRAVLHASGDKAGILVYLPEALADKLPLYQRFGARLVAEAHLSVDQYETHTLALEVLALGREVQSSPAAWRG